MRVDVCCYSNCLLNVCIFARDISCNNRLFTASCVVTSLFTAVKVIRIRLSLYRASLLVAAFYCIMDFDATNIGTRGSSLDLIRQSMMNWNMCIICQSDGKEKLQCPAESKRSDVGAGYHSFVDILPRFKDVGALPPHLSADLVDEGKGVWAALTEHKAKWHKSCRLLFYPRELERAEARKTRTLSCQQEQPDDLRYSSPIKRRCTRALGQPVKTDCVFDPKCIFCNKTAHESGLLHDVTTFKLNDKVKECANKLCDERLLAKLSAASDMMALSAKYHTKCLAQLYNRVRALNRKQVANSQAEEDLVHGLVFAQLVSYIDDFRFNDDVTPIFKLCDIVKMYNERVKQLGGISGSVHSTRLKEQLLSHYSDLCAHDEGRDVLLMLDCDIGPAVMKACRANFYDDALCLSHAAQIVRREMFKPVPTFEGSFLAACQSNSVPKSVLALVSMILEGPSISQQSNPIHVPAALQVSQLIVYNSVKAARPGAKFASAVKPKEVRHRQQRETPLPLYAGLFLYAKMRKKVVLDKLSKLGLCVPYNRIICLTADLANAVSEIYNKQNIVCPPVLHRGEFTVAAVDNIDHNPSSTTAKGSFHGTAISLMQHPQSDKNTTQLSVDISCVRRKKSVFLPEYYTTVDAVMLTSMEPSVPEMLSQVLGEGLSLPAAEKQQKEWLYLVSSAIESSSDSCKSGVSWSAFHSERQLISSISPAICALLPLFRESSNSVAMIKHAMDVVKVALNHLNPGQTPVMAADQPLYTLVKIIQWNFPELYGEGQFVAVLGGLHIEMAALKAIGSFIKGSRWVEAITEAGISTQGTADAFLTAAHLRRCRHAHEVTAASLNILQNRAYSAYKATCSDASEMQSFETWRSKQISLQPQFAYWALILEFELAILRFVQSIRSSNFNLYIDTLTNLAPWFFVMDRTHYARWLSVHIRDMTELSHKNPDVFKEFIAGKFTVNKSNRSFSAMAIDQAHEQMNAAVKGDGGAIGLTENENALRRWLIAGPEIARILQEFELGKGNLSGPLLPHHEHKPAIQNKFLKEVKALTAKIEELGNPFLDDSGTLSSLHSKDVVDPSIATSVNTAFALGKFQFDAFVKERLVERSVSLFHPLKRNKFLLFEFICRKTNPKLNRQVAGLKNDCVLFSRLYIGCQTRSGNIDEFFEHENQSAPPSLSDGGKLRFTVKADLLKCLDTVSPPIKHILLDDSAVILDGAALVQMLKPGSVKTFGDYAAAVFLPFITAQFRTACRVDIVWDRYDSNSLKMTAREARGVGIRRHVACDVPIPRNWQAFLRTDMNKTELFSFLSTAASKMHLEPGKQLIATLDQKVITVPVLHDVTRLSPCSHEEADTRLILHAAHAAQGGVKRLLIRSVDTDVVVLAVAFRQHIACDELWIAFGTGKHFRYIAVHEIADTLGPLKSAALPVFHAITGCDTTSSFAGKGKKTAWDTWTNNPDITAAFLEISSCPSSISDFCFSVIERFVVKLYDRTTNSQNVNLTRKQLFAQKGRTLESIPPTRDALLQHVKRAAYQSGYVWSQCLVVKPTLPNPSEWGWSLINDVWQPLWITQSVADGFCQELLRCGCKTGCKTRLCKCVRSNLKCTALCGCGGECRSLTSCSKAV